ncbi:unnamed protein product [Heterobilharzia americana]|nr:unnamed protein product [Heterobilharzia americana]
MLHLADRIQKSLHPNGTFSGMCSVTDCSQLDEKVGKTDSIHNLERNNEFDPLSSVRPKNISSSHPPTYPSIPAGNSEDTSRPKSHENHVISQPSISTSGSLNNERTIISEKSGEHESVELQAAVGNKSDMIIEKNASVLHNCGSTVLPPQSQPNSLSSPSNIPNFYQQSSGHPSYPPNQSTMQPPIPLSTPSSNAHPQPPVQGGDVARLPVMSSTSVPTLPQPTTQPFRPLGSANLPPNMGPYARQSGNFPNTNRPSNMISAPPHPSSNIFTPVVPPCDQSVGLGTPQRPVLQPPSGSSRNSVTQSQPPATSVFPHQGMSYPPMYPPSVGHPSQSMNSATTRPTGPPNQSPLMSGPYNSVQSGSPHMPPPPPSNILPKPGPPTSNETHSYYAPSLNQSYPNY